MFILIEKEKKSYLESIGIHAEVDPKTALSRLALCGKAWVSNVVGKRRVYEIVCDAKELLDEEIIPRFSNCNSESWKQRKYFRNIISYLTKNFGEDRELEVAIVCNEDTSEENQSLGIDDVILFRECDKYDTI